MKTFVVITVVLTSVSGACWAQSAVDSCLPSTAMSVEQDVAALERQCQMNREILVHCKADRMNNLMAQAFAQNIVEQVRQEECGRQESEWVARNNTDDLTCFKAQQELATAMQQYALAQAKYDEDLERYETFWADRLPAGAGESDIDIRACWGDGCPPHPGVAPSTPAASSCIPFACQVQNEAALEKKAKAKALNVLNRDFKVRFEALAHDCKEKRLRVTASERDRRIRDEHKQGMEDREEALEREIEDWTTARDGRRKIREIAAESDDAGDLLAGPLDSVPNPTSGQFYPVDPRNFRPERIRYGIAPQFRSGSNEPVPGHVASQEEEQRLEHCREVLVLADKMLATDRRIVELIDVARSKGQSEKGSALEEQLHLLRKEYQSVERQAKECEAN